MKKTIIGVIVFVIAVLTFIRWFSGEEEYYNLKLEKLKQEYSVTPVSSIDHSKLSALQKKFASPQEVTEACNSCHTERHREVMNSAHWNWERVSYVEGRGITAAGKKKRA